MVLSALGIAAMVAVVGISTSSRARLNRTLDRLGTNLLTAGLGKSLFGENAKLPAMISVLEWRAEIGLRRSLGATRGQVCWQFIVEAQLLSGLGGVGGVLSGDRGDCRLRHQPGVGRRWSHCR